MARRKVKDNPGLERDMSSNAIINTNRNAFALRRAQIAEDKRKEAEFEQMKSEIASMKARHEVNQGVVQGWVDVAPAMGMIGTLIGLVLMLGNMGDPKSIGPAMAVALLTTLYGAFVANVLFAPIVGKLEYYTSYEIVYREIVLEGLRGIARSESPRNIQDQMAAALPPKLQSKFELAA